MNCTAVAYVLHNRDYNLSNIRIIHGRMNKGLVHVIFLLVVTGLVISSYLTSLEGKHMIVGSQVGLIIIIRAFLMSYSFD